MSCNLKLFCLRESLQDSDIIHTIVLFLFIPDVNDKKNNKRRHNMQYKSQFEHR